MARFVLPIFGFQNTNTNGITKPISSVQSEMIPSGLVIYFPLYVYLVRSATGVAVI
jgi:Zn-dependent M16 (insulinase) family peptidase